jgi:hypothetical protein
MHRARRAAWAGHAPPGVAYVSMRPTASMRGRPSISEVRGILQVDGYGAYAQLAQHGDLALFLLEPRAQAVLRDPR